MEVFFNQVLEKAFDNVSSEVKYQSIGGGCINNAAKLSVLDQDYFIKWNNGKLDMFEKELLGLQLLKTQLGLNIPTTYQTGEIDGKGYLLMEYIEVGAMNKSFWESLGIGLAALHKRTNDQFGLDHNNYIGRLDQKNNFHDDWVEFFIHSRLLPQIKLARDASLIDQRLITKFEVLFGQLNDLFPNEPPALLHGDLWSGNIHCGIGSKAYLIDPAVYFGHREVDLAFSRLFGGFDSIFYKSYENNYPTAPGFEARIDIYNLYPLLVHVNLFGSSYLSGIIHTLRKHN